MAIAMSKDRIDELMAFIRHPFGRLGAGLRTYSDGADLDLHGGSLHEACLELERRGLLARVRERVCSDGVLMIQWQPAGGHEPPLPSLDAG